MLWPFYLLFLFLEDSNKVETTETSLSFDNLMTSTSCPTISSSVDFKILIHKAESFNSLMDIIDPNLMTSNPASSLVSSDISLKTQIFNENANNSKSQTSNK